MKLIYTPDLCSKNKDFIQLYYKCIVENLPRLDRYNKTGKIRKLEWVVNLYKEIWPKEGLVI